MLRYTPRNIGSYCSRRSFWTVARGRTQGTILAADSEVGLIFKHKQFRYRFTGTLQDKEATFRCSLGKCTDSDLILKDIEDHIGQEAVIEYEQHLFGAPWKGFTLDPIYLKSITFENK